MKIITNTQKSWLIPPRMPGTSGGVWLPGSVEIPDKQWKLLAGHSTIQQWITGGLISVSEAASPAAARPAEPPSSEPPPVEEGRENLVGITIAEAQRLIEGEADPEKLDRWADSDTRTGIIEAITRRLDALGA